MCASNILSMNGIRFFISGFLPSHLTVQASTTSCTTRFLLRRIGKESKKTKNKNRAQKIESQQRLIFFCHLRREFFYFALLLLFLFFTGTFIGWSWIGRRRIVFGEIWRTEMAGWSCMYDDGSGRRERERHANRRNRFNEAERVETFVRFVIPPPPNRPRLFHPYSIDCIHRYILYMWYNTHQHIYIYIDCILIGNYVADRCCCCSLVDSIFFFPTPSLPSTTSPNYCRGIDFSLHVYRELEESPTEDLACHDSQPASQPSSILLSLSFFSSWLYTHVE